MRSKKWLSFLMALCLVISAVAPTVGAVTTDSKVSVIKEKKANSDRVSALENKLLVGEKSADEINSLRGQKPVVNTETDQASQEGTWVVTPSDVKPSVERPSAQLLPVRQSCVRLPRSIPTVRGFLPSSSWKMLP